MLNRTQLVSTTQTTDNKNIQQHTPDVIGHTHTYRNTNTEQQPNNTTEDQNDRGRMTRQAHPQIHKRKIFLKVHAWFPTPVIVLLHPLLQMTGIQNYRSSWRK